MWRAHHPPRPSRLVVALTLVVLALLAGTACSSAKDQKNTDAITKQIQATLAQRPDVANADVRYQNNLDASARADASIQVKPGADLAPVLDETVRLIWQSKLTPLSSINVDANDVASPQRGDERRVNLLNKDENTQLEAKYGPRPK